MINPLVKYSKLVNLRNKVFLYFAFVILCSIVGFTYGLYLPLVPMSTVKIMLLPILLLGLVGIWMMPERETLLENTIRNTLFVFLLFWCLWPPYLSILKFPGEPWMSPQRILTYILLVMSLLMYSVSKTAKQILGENYDANKIIFRAMLLFIFASGMSVFFSSNIELSSVAFIEKIMYNFIIFYLAATLISNEKHLNIVFMICVFSALILGLMSFYENTLSQTIWSYHIPRNMFAGTEDVQRILTPKFRFGDYRVKGSSLTSLEYAELFAYIIPMCLYFLLDHKNKLMKLLMVITIGAILYAIIVSRSRLGLVGAIVSMFNYSFLIALRTWRLHTKSLLGSALLSLYPAGLVAFTVLVMSSTTLTKYDFGQLNFWPWW